ncbi:FAD binding domain-containing protein [Advenella mimigardefordensis]|uniref:Putative carbon monoxide dehydrogenase medium chain n=1 Tax=Advenella mimigardefordensis (strain DSM 17166 / LMG 22922 / DPN7) TaxID=1247726 RepID=W0PKH3_ADVMD|nr:FAD binding domain-containing protein [Advenella mimigardefordensis]AHG65503.1 putative carbon monoxide dehydrogenase medium chain [Advenella mimigardefordensis DPN7]
MKPQAFEYRRVNKVSEALQWLDEDGENARILAGGQSLVILLNMRLAQPARLLDISRCAELNYLRQEKGMLCIGASTTQARLQYWPELAETVPLLAEAIPFISHYQIRNRGTVVGSIAHADPSAELPLCLATLGGCVVLRSRKKSRELAVAQFQQGMLTTAKQTNEMVTEVRFPVASQGHGYAFDEFALRRGDFAIVACAAQVGPEMIRLGIGGVADKPVVAEWKRSDAASFGRRLNDLAWQLNAQDDQHASAAYRRHLVRELGQNTIETALSRCAGNKE